MLTKLITIAVALEKEKKSISILCDPTNPYAQDHDFMIVRHILIYLFLPNIVAYIYNMPLYAS